MHNCGEAKDRLTELALDEAVLPAELRKCDECRAEFEALNATLRATSRLRETVAPPENYWMSYHAVLRDKLVHAKAQRGKENLSPLRLSASILVKSFKSSVRVPVPVGIALIILFSIVGLFAMRKPAAQPPSPIVVHVPVEVPVIQEKTVKQVVYRDRRRTSKSSKRASIAPASENTFARSQPIDLNGFKPTEEVKLTVIKGGIPNEK